MMVINVHMCFYIYVFLYRFNEDVFERYEREKRKKLMDLRRHGGHLLYPSPTVSPVKAHAGSRDGVAKKAIAHTSSSSSSSTANILSPNKSSRGGSNTNKSKSNSNSSSNSSSNSRTSDMTAREKRYSKWLASRVKPAQPKSEAAKFADLLKKG